MPTEKYTKPVYEKIVANFGSLMHMIAPLFEAEEMMFSKSDQTEEYYTNEKVYKRRKDILDSTFNHLSSVTQKGDIQSSLYSII